MLRINVFGLDIYGCHEALERLDDYTDRELSPQETQKVRQHLKICHHCARKFNFEAELVTGIRNKTQKIMLPTDMDSFKSKIGALLDKEVAGDSEKEPPS